MSRVTVVSEKGKLVGTWIPPQQPPQPGAPVTELVPGLGQKLHVIEVKDAELFHSRAKSEELVKLVKKQLKLK
jgi:hypothetical protein